MTQNDALNFVNEELPKGSFVGIAREHNSHFGWVVYYWEDTNSLALVRLRLETVVDAVTGLIGPDSVPDYIQAVRLDGTGSVTFQHNGKAAMVLVTRGGFIVSGPDGKEQVHDTVEGVSTRVAELLGLM